MRHKDHINKGRQNYFSKFSTSEMVEFTTTTVTTISIEKSAALTSDLNHLGKGLLSENMEGQLEAARQLRLMLSSERDMVVHEVSILGKSIYSNE